jgi:hypothetical protein
VLFIDYLLSEEEQKIIMSTNRMPAHAKVKSPEGQLLEGQDVRTPDIFDIDRRYPNDRQSLPGDIRRSKIIGRFKTLPLLPSSPAMRGGNRWGFELSAAVERFERLEPSICLSS